LKWHDSDSAVFTCDWYGGKDKCAQYGNDFENMDKTANEGCCVCGGGVSNASSSTAPSNIPSAEPSLSTVPSLEASSTPSVSVLPSEGPSTSPSEQLSNPPTSEKSFTTKADLQNAAVEYCKAPNKRIDHSMYITYG
jgi:hypothetical protein